MSGSIPVQEQKAISLACASFALEGRWLSVGRKVCLASGPRPGRAVSIFHVGKVASSALADPSTPCQRECGELETQTGWLGVCG